MKKILVVDDDPDILEAISLILEEERFVVDTITKGEQTYKKIKSFSPDLILLDILMSGSDGRTICKTIKEDEQTKQIPVIMMSAHPNAARDTKACGADGFLAKPFETEDLIKIITSNLKK